RARLVSNARLRLAFAGKTMFSPRASFLPRVWGTTRFPTPLPAHGRTVGPCARRRRWRRSLAALSSGPRARRRAAPRRPHPRARLHLALGFAMGVRSPSGPRGVLVLLLFAVLVSLSFGALGAFLAYRLGSGESIQAMFPVLFVFLFISSMNAPRNLIGVHWF